MALTVEEARLLAVYRAIKEFDQPNLVSTSDVGAAVQAFSSVVDVEKEEKDLSNKELQLLIRGFVAGLAAGAPSPPDLFDGYMEFDPESRTEFKGGHTGGTAVGQGEDPRYVESSADYGNVEEVK